MGKLVAVFGDAVALENALGALASAGLSDMTRVVGEAVYSDAPADPERRLARGESATATGSDRGRATYIVPPAAGGGSAVPAASPGVLAPLPVPPEGSAAVDMVGSGFSAIDATKELERVTGATTEEATFYADVIRGGGSLLVVEGDATALDRAEVALEDHAAQGMTRH